MKKRSNLDIIGADKAIFCLKALLLSYRPPIGLAAARMDVLAFRVACQKKHQININIELVPTDC